MTWSQIQDTELATLAYVQMNENEINGCFYHNNNHIQAMYQYLEDTGVPYDEALDWAVMFHDVVYDALPDKEQRSAQMFFDEVYKSRGCKLDVCDIDRVQFLIMATKDHLVESDVYLKGSAAIIRADLHALTDKKTAASNFIDIMNESLVLYGCTVEEFAHNTESFMYDLKERMLLNILSVDKDDELFYNEVIKGIDTTINLAKVLK